MHALSKVNNETLIRIKRWCYLLFLLPILLPPLSMLAAAQWGAPNIWSWSVVFFVFGLVPILDVVVGKDPSNPNSPEMTDALASDTFYRNLTLIGVPFYFALIVYGAEVFASSTLTWPGKIGWVLSIGTVGALGITIAHELIHKSEKAEQLAGGVLLSMVTYGGFKVEHLRGHHVNVSTPADASSSRFNQSLYNFLPKAYWHNFRNAWSLEAKRLKGKGLPVISVQNELLWWYGLSFIIMLVFGYIFGPMGALFFVAQSFVAFTLLEIVNYLEHYGLHRRKLDNGRYERVTPAHSWNSNHFVTNLLLFHLQRHSDHHAYAKRRFQILRHHEDAPQLPAGYATMVLLALVPPLWRKVMNPRVKAYYLNEEHQLN